MYETVISVQLRILSSLSVIILKTLSRSYQLFILLRRGVVEDLFIHSVGSRCSYVVERVLMVRWVVESIPHSGPIELFFVPASVALLVYQRP